MKNEMRNMRKIPSVLRPTTAFGIFFVFHFLFSLSTMGQGVVHGVVSDAGMGNPLEFVNVGVLGGTVGTVTDGGGMYSLKIPTADSVTLRFSFTGYEPVEVRVKPDRREAVRLDVRLKAAAKRLDEVEVSDEKNRQTTFTKIDVQKLDDAVGPTGGVEGVLKTLPGFGASHQLPYAKKAISATKL